MSDQVLHIAIDVSLAEDQIHGQVGDGVRQPTPFSGWLGLIGQLDRMLGNRPRPAVTHDDPVSDDPGPGEENQ
jgi:hypothetical protein